MVAAQHLKTLRLEKNLTQEYLAFELGVSQKTYSNLENGYSRITLRLLKDIAKVYNTNVVDLITKLFENDPEVIAHLKKPNQEMSNFDIYNGVSNNLPMELLAAYKARIVDLNKIINIKDEQIADLRRQII